MSLLPMYPMSKSIITRVRDPISATANEITVIDVAAFPDAPNFATIGTENNAEVIFYQGKDVENNKLTGCLRGQSHTIPRGRESGAFIYHSWCADNANAIMENIRTLADQGGGGGTSGGVVASGAGAHNAVYRGKLLGNAVTDEQYAAISSGTFDDLYIGDYWTIGDVNYRIAAFDYFYNCGGSIKKNCTTHHAVIVPDTALYDATMNATDSTTGGYVGSLMRTTNLAQAKTIINEAFAGHVMKHYQRLTNAVTNGRASGGAWLESTVDLMNELMAYGSGIFAPVSDGTYIPENYTPCKSQLPLFAMRHDIISNSVTYWLRDVISSRHFAMVGNNGNAHCYAASFSCGVRPVFCIS